MPALTLDDLVRNGTMSPEMAVTLATATGERRSILSVARPRLAGKSTVLAATLAHAPTATPIHHLSRAAGSQLGIPPTGDGGYLLVSEFSPAGFDEYLWGPDVRHVFEALSAGFSLAATLHAGDIEEVFEVLIAQNRVPDEQAARVDLVICIRTEGPWQRPTRRFISAVYEVEGVRNGHPDARLLHRWSDAQQRFEVIDQPLRIGIVSSPDRM